MRYYFTLDSAYAYKTYENQNLHHQSLLAAGKDEGIGHFGTFTLDALRIEKGFKMWGNEMNLDVDAWEAGLGSFIRMKKKVGEIGRKGERKCKSLRVIYGVRR